MTSHYETLGVTRSASQEQIKAHWQTLSREFHPDRGGNAAEFAELSQAYSTLRDPKARAAYDAQQALLTDPCLVCKGEGQVYKQRGFTERVSKPCQVCNGTGRTKR